MMKIYLRYSFLRIFDLNVFLILLNELIIKISKYTVLIQWRINPEMSYKPYKKMCVINILQVLILEKSETFSPARRRWES